MARLPARSSTCFGAVGAALVMLASIAPCRAAPTTNEEVVLAREEARSLAKLGLARLDAGDFQAGIELIERAEARFHAPTHLLYLAQAHASLGQAGRAARIYAQLIAETLPNYAPAEFREAQRIARDELLNLVARVARVRIEHDRSDARTFELVVDGERMTSFPPELYVDPGDHDLALTADGENRKARVTGRAGESVTLKVVFGPRPTQPVRREDPKPVEGTSPLTLAGGALIGLGGAAVISGIVTGALSFSVVAELAARCPQKQNCDPADEALADEARALGNGSTAAFVTGGAFAVAGVVMMLWPKPKPQPPAQVKVTRRARELQPIVGPTWVGIAGRF